MYGTLLPSTRSTSKIVRSPPTMFMSAAPNTAGSHYNTPAKTLRHVVFIVPGVVLHRLTSVGTVIASNVTLGPKPICLQSMQLERCPLRYLGIPTRSRLHPTPTLYHWMS